MDSLRILHITPYASGAWAYGGIPRVVDVLCRQLTAQGHAVTTCTTDVRDGTTRLDRPDRASARAPWPRVAREHGGEVRVFPNVSNRLAYRGQMFLPIGLRAFLREAAGQFDIAHLHACRNLPGVIAARALDRAGVPYVLSPHGTAPRIERRFLAKRAFDLVAGRRVMAGAAAVLAVSGAEREQLLSMGIRDASIHVVPNPIDLDEWSGPVPRGGFRRRHGLTDEPLVVYLGKLTPRKRVDCLIEAFARMSDTRAQLVIAGNDMGVERALRRLAQAQGIGARTHFLGLVTDRERSSLLADADVVVYPSAHEAFGLVPIEAILSGTPVVVSNDSGCGEIVRSVGGGVVTEGGDPEAVRRAIETVLQAPHVWREAVRGAALQVRQRFGAERVAQELVEIYVESRSGPNTLRSSAQYAPRPLATAPIVRASR